MTVEKTPAFALERTLPRHFAYYELYSAFRDTPPWGGEILNYISGRGALITEPSKPTDEGRKCNIKEHKPLLFSHIL